MTIDLSPEEIQLISITLCFYATMPDSPNEPALTAGQWKQLKALRMKIDSLVLKNAMENK